MSTAGDRAFYGEVAKIKVDVKRLADALSFALRANGITGPNGPEGETWWEDEDFLEIAKDVLAELNQNACGFDPGPALVCKTCGYWFCTEPCPDAKPAEIAPPELKPEDLL